MASVLPPRMKLSQRRRKRSVKALNLTRTEHRVVFPLLYDVLCKYSIFFSIKHQIIRKAIYGIIRLVRLPRTVHGCVSVYACCDERSVRREEGKLVVVTKAEGRVLLGVL